MQVLLTEEEYNKLKNEAKDKIDSTIKEKLSTLAEDLTKATVNLKQSGHIFMSGEVALEAFIVEVREAMLKARK